MQQILQEVSLTDNKFASFNPSSVDKSQASHARDDGPETDPPEEKDCGRTQERNGSDKENVSQLGYGARDEYYGNHDTGTWLELGSDTLSEDFLKPLETKETMMKRIPSIIIPSLPDPKPKKILNPVVAALKNAASSKVPDVTPMQEILNSKDLPISIRKAYSHSLLPTVYEVMLRHKTCKEAQVLGAQFLQKITIHVPKAANEIGEQKGVQLIIRSMILNHDCLAVQTATAAALAVLCSTSQNRIIAGEFYAVEAIMTTSRKFPEERYLQGACMKILTSLALEPENIDVIVNTKSIRLPLRVIKHHRQSNVLVRIACECAHQLLKSFDETDMEQMTRINPMKIFIAALMAFPDDERIQVAGTESATFFCSVDSECLTTCVNTKAPDLCVRNLKRFRGCEHARLHLACMKMLCLFVEAGFSRDVVTAGALEGCLPSMIEMRKVFSMQACCLRLLEGVVTTGEESFLERIVAAGGLEVINASLKTYISREAFVDRGVRVMRVLRG